MSDTFTYEDKVDSPASYAVPVVPHDVTLLDRNTKALYVGTAGDVKATMRGGGDVTFKAVPAGTVLPIRVVRVFATGTTAADIVALS
jgi:hypothetical protein